MDERTGSGWTIITGAASGMGQAAAELMQRGGARLLLCDIHDDRLRETAERLGGDTPATLAGDIAEEGFGQRLADALGGDAVAALVHCAGLSPTMADPRRILDVNLAATIRLVDAVRPRMAEGGAAVIFASSAAYEIGAAMDEAIGAVRTPGAVATLLDVAADPGMAYTVAKRGVLLLARREAAAFAERGARIVSLSPGIIDTPMQRGEAAGHPIIRAMIERSALKRPARAEEVASVAAFLVSPAASFVTGIDVLVDGGAMAATGR